MSLGTSQDLLESYESYDRYNGPKSNQNQQKSNQNQGQMQSKSKSKSKSNPNQSKSFADNSRILVILNNPRKESW